MDMLINLDGVITGFSVIDNQIDCICGKRLLKIDKDSGDILLEKTLFENEGLSRRLVANNGRIYIYDFCTLYLLNQSNYELLGKWKLGSDLSSDICGITADETKAYCSIRNGKIITVDRNSFDQQQYDISDSSMWSMEIYKDYLLCGTVNGELLIMNRVNLNIYKRLELGKQNISRLFIEGNMLYACGQDKKLYRINLDKMVLEDMKRNVHKKMFECVGIYKDEVVTVSYPCCEIALWNRETLEEKKRINIPLRLSGFTYMEGNKIYFTSRNITGIGVISL